MSRIITSIRIKVYKVFNQIAKADSLEINLQAPLKRPESCIRCGSRSLQSKGAYTRRVHHLESFGRTVRLKIRCRRFRCKFCARSFVEPLPGILPGRHSSEPFRESLYTLHHEGIPSSVMGRLKKVASATVSHIYSQFTARKVSERLSLECPLVLGKDEHTLHKKKQFATTFCDLGNLRLSYPSTQQGICLTSPLGLQCVATPTMPSADFSRAIPPLLKSGRHHCSTRDLPG